MKYAGIDVPFGADGLPLGVPQQWGIPTLGPDVLAWSEYYLVQPDGEFAGEQWVWRDSQARFICWWYAIDFEGEYIFRRAQIVLPKGAGKSPLAAALGCCALLGPSVFDRFEDGIAVGKRNPSPSVQLAAVSQDQTDNTMSLVLAMVKSTELEAERPDINAGTTRIRVRNGKLVPVTASAPSREGGRTTDAIFDETHLWVDSNGGTNLAKTIRRNLGKMNGRSIETTNCWSPGRNSIAEKTSELADAVREGRSDETGVLRWHPREVVEDLSDEPAVRAALGRLYADSPWINIDRLVNEIFDLSTSPAEARRFYLNEVSTSDDAWISQPEWVGCFNAEAVVGDGDTITVGFDGSRRRARGVTDATALIGCRVEDGYLFEIAVWEQPEGAHDWPIPVAEVDAAVRDTFRRYNVVGFFADPAKWESQISTWEAAYSSRLTVKASRDAPMHWWMTGGRATATVRALDQFLTAVLEKQLSHDGSFALTRHILNAQRRVSTAGIQIAKEHPDSSRKIDAAVAAVLAWTARIEAIGQPQEPKRSKSLVRF